MNQSFVTGADQAPEGPSSALETPTLLAAGEGAIVPDGFDFLAEVRTHMTTILGFSEMLADPALDLSDQKRAEYGFIVATSGALLAERLERESEDLRLAC